MKKYISILVIFFIVIFAVITAYLIKVERIAVENFKSSNIKNIQFSSSLLRQKIDKVFYWLRVVSGYPDIVNFNDRGKKLLKTLYLPQGHTVRGISRVSKDMKLIYTYPDESAIGKDLSAQTHNQYIHRYHRPVLSSPFKTVQGYRAIVAEYPIFDKKHNYMGGIGLLFDFDKFVSHYLQNIDSNRYCKILLLDKRGYILFSNYLDALGEPLEDVLSNSEEELLNFIAKAKREDRYTGYFSVSGQKCIGSFIAFDVSGYNRWIIISYAELSDIFRGTNVNLFYVISISILVIIFGLISYYIYRMILDERKRLHEELRNKTQSLVESENRLRLMFDSLDELVSLVNHEYTIEYANESMISALGYDPTGNRCFEAYGGRKEPCSECTMKKVLKGKSVIGHEIRFVKNNRYYLTNNYPIKNPDGNLSQLSIMYDITEVKKLELERQQIFRAINNAEEMIVICDKNMRIKYLNEAYTQITGFSTHRIIGKSYRAVLDYIGRRDVYRAIDAAVRKRQPWKGEITARRRDGSEIIVYASFSPLYENDTLYGYIGLVRDITKERESEITLRRILEKSPIIILRLNNDYNVTSANTTFCKLTGWEEEDIIGKNIFDVFVRKEDREYVMAEIAKADGEINRAQPIIKKDGNFIFVSWINLPMTDIDGKRYGTFCIGVDSTREKELESRYLQAQKMEAVGRLAGGIAHDFNNLLTAIIGNVELAKMYLEWNESPLEPLLEIKAAVERSEALTRRLLLLSRNESGANFEIIDCNEIISGMEKMFRRIIKENIKLKLDLDSNLARVKGIRSQIEQIFLNLVINASDAMPEGGAIKICTQNVRGNEGKVREIKITVEDTGVGMDKNVMEHIFEPFFTTKAEGKGTGLGLSTVYGIVKSHKGEIRVSSVVGKGTRFEIFLPCVEWSEKSTATDVARSSNSSVEHERSKVSSALDEKTNRKRDKRILVVEDENTIRKILVRTLREYGYDIVEAEDGLDALKKITLNGKVKTDFWCDLLITDVIMPGMGGKELFEQIKKYLPEIRVIFVSGYDDGNLNGLLIDGKNIKFIRKPYRVRDIINSIEEMLSWNKESS